MNDYPFVSVLMPVRNEAEFMERSLGAVLAQDYPAERMEIFVVDGMSSDNTREVVALFQAGHSNVKLLNNPGRIVATGLNAALSMAAGEIIIRVDGHCKIAPDYVRRCVEHLQTDGVEAVGGPVDTVSETETAEAIAVAMSSSFGVGGSAFRTVKDKTMLTDTVAFPAYTRDVIEQAGPYDEELVRNQDDEYNYRLRGAGARILLAQDVRSRYYSRSSLRSLWRQYFQYGYWKVRVMQKHPLQMRMRQFAPPSFAAFLVLSLIALSFSRVARWIFVSTVVSYIAANLVASLLTTRQRGRLLPVLPLCFAILHLAYGIGFLTGLVRFWNRWGDRETRAIQTEFRMRNAQ